MPFAVRRCHQFALPQHLRRGLSARQLTQDDTGREILDYDQRLPEFRRNADQRYYKGTEYANILESLARRRAAELFAGNGVSADDLFVNVQPLSGAPANNAVYSALLDVGDTVMGMDLIMGGHLTHGSPVNRSGINYNIVSYTIEPRHRAPRLRPDPRPRARAQTALIIGGFSSYPYAADWDGFPQHRRRSRRLICSPMSPMSPA